MEISDLSKWGARIAAWSADYLTNLRQRPVRAQTHPGDIARQIAKAPPEQPEAFETIFADFERQIMPGMTHWQHPRFFAYFPANASPPSVIAEYLTATLAAQCMLWQTSPAATELETVMMDWLRQMIGLPEGFSGVIQDLASSATLAALLTARERALDWQGNQRRPLRPTALACLRLGALPFLDRQGLLGRGHRPGQSGEASGIGPALQP